MEFGKKVLQEEDICGQRVIEVGSLDVNGSLRPMVESFSPREYIGVDMQMGRGVDQICDAAHLLNRFGSNRFDVVISTELLEHVINWQKVVHNLKQILKPGGLLLLTTRSRGFQYHGYPFDFWRYELSDIKFIFFT